MRNSPFEFFGLGISSSVRLRAGSVDLFPHPTSCADPGRLPTIRNVVCLAGAFVAALLAPRAASSGLPLAQEALAAPAAGANLTQEKVLLSLSPKAGLETVLVDEAADGSLWARGVTYKARFGPDRVDFYPFLGPRAPRLFPLSLSVHSASLGARALDGGRPAAPSKDGLRVTYDRGGVLEVYELRPREIEQLFVVPAAGGAGDDLKVRLDVSTEMALAGSTSEGLRYEAPDGSGGVLYGRAIAIDASGRRKEAATSIAGEGIEIRVAASDLADAAFPLTIDPVLTPTFPVAAAPAVDAINADVAYDVTADVWCVCFEDIFAAADHDVYVRFVSDPADVAAPFVTAPFVIDVTADDWRHPRIANNNFSGNFLVVAQRWNGADWDLYGRVRTAAGVDVSGQDPITGADDAGIDETNPDVGGDGLGVAAVSEACIVVWEQEPGFGGSVDIHAGRVVPDAAPALEEELPIADTGADEQDPAVSKSNGPPGYWGVVWSGDDNIYFNDVSFAGGFDAADEFTVIDDGDIHGLPDVAVNTANQFLVVWQADDGATLDVKGRAIAGAGAGAAFDLTPEQNLSASEPVPAIALDQGLPSVDGDGCNFTYAYTEEDAGGDFDVFTANVFLRLAVPDLAVPAGEGHVLLADSATEEGRTKTSSRWSSSYAPASRVRFMSVWEDHTAAGNSDIEAAFYSPGDVVVVDTECGMGPPTIAFSGSPSCGGNLCVDGTDGQGGFLFLFIGVPAFVDLGCGLPADCILGVVLPPIAAVAFGDVCIPVPCDPGLIGVTLAFQEAEVSAGALAGGCPLGAGSLTLSDTLNVTVR